MVTEQSIDRRKGQLILYEPCPRCKGQQIEEHDSRYDLSYILCLHCGREQYSKAVEAKEGGKRGITSRQPRKPDA